MIVDISNISIPERDRILLRELAKRVKEISELPEMEAKRKQWYKLNSLRAERPLILTCPGEAWPEIIGEEDLKCEAPQLRGFERALREMIYHHDVIKDDYVVEPYINLYWKMDTGDTYGFKLDYHQVKHEGIKKGSFVWEPPVKDIDRDMEKLKPRVVTIYKEDTLREKQLAEEVFGDIISIKINHPYWNTAGITHHVTELVGLEGFMYLCYDDPDGLHRLFSWLRDEHVAFDKKLEAEGILQLNNLSNDIGSGGLGFISELPGKDYNENDNVRMRDVWGFANSQESAGLSPEMYKEFIFPYEKDILEPYGLNCYGCCEPIHNRLDYVMEHPNLRVISVSPWSDVKLCADRIQRKYVYSWKPNPSLVCADFSEGGIRNSIRDALKAAGHLNMNIILKDVETLQNEPWRIARWAEIAREEVESL